MDNKLNDYVLPPPAASSSGSSSNSSSSGSCCKQPKTHYEFAKFLFISSSRLKYPIETAATSIAILHRYGNAMGDTRLLSSNYVVMISSILFLAGKSTENFRRVKEILTVVLRVFDHPYRLDDAKAVALQAKVIELEQSILRALAFQLDIKLPYSYLMNAARSIGSSCGQVKLAWGLVNDIILHKEFADECPVSIAIVALYIASELDVKV